jgi:site-specific DNA recombinase
MNVALSARVSTNRQHQTQTIAQQWDRLQAYIAIQSAWHLADEHIDRAEGYSGASLHRPGPDRLRDHAALAALERVLMTSPDRLARTYVHQVWLLEELAEVGCEVVCLDRPRSDNPHAQRLLHIRGAVAEYERRLMADRMRRGRQAGSGAGNACPGRCHPMGIASIRPTLALPVVSVSIRARPLE